MSRTIRTAIVILALVFTASGCGAVKQALETSEPPTTTTVPRWFEKYTVECTGEVQRVAASKSTPSRQTWAAGEYERLASVSLMEDRAFGRATSFVDGNDIVMAIKGEIVSLNPGIDLSRLPAGGMFTSPKECHLKQRS